MAKKKKNAYVIFWHNAHAKSTRECFCIETCTERELKEKIEWIESVCGSAGYYMFKIKNMVKG